jgi:hypothetical protein
MRFGSNVASQLLRFDEEGIGTKVPPAAGITKGTRFTRLEQSAVSRLNTKLWRLAEVEERHIGPGELVSGAEENAKGNESGSQKDPPPDMKAVRRQPPFGRRVLNGGRGTDARVDRRIRAGRR